MKVYKMFCFSFLALCIGIFFVISHTSCYSLEQFVSRYGHVLDGDAFVSNDLHLKYDPEVYMNASQLITSKGYPCEDYEVVTADGFVLGLQRIPHGLQKESKSVKKPVVFLQHGLLCSSTNWITNLKNESLAFILADNGYDVWLGNNRGNTYSRQHIKYKPSQKEFWNWSWDEMVRYDIPAMINFALNKTTQPSLYYVGHSQGTLIMFAHLSEDESFSSKIKIFFALGPVATVEYIESPLRVFASVTKEIEGLYSLLGVGEFLPNNEVFKLLGTTMCRIFARAICENVLFLIAGFDNQQLNATRLPVYLTHTPAGTSVVNMVHFAQMVRSGKFQKYDYGSAEKNRQHYNQSTAPLYDATKIKAPVALFSGQYDWLADPWDVLRLSSQLPHIVHEEEISAWDHLDFIWAMDAASRLYPNIIKIIEKTENGRRAESTTLNRSL